MSRLPLTCPVGWDPGGRLRAQEELSALLGAGGGMLNADEEAEVEGELAALEDVVQDEETLALPTVPTTKARGPEYRWTLSRTLP
jgi:hypothetical protein